VVKLGQKSQLEGTRADKLITGNRIYGVGYGYNIVTNEIANNQIVAIANAIAKNRLTSNGIDAEYKIRDYRGSCFSQLCNDLKADAKFSGEFFNFKAEAGASFDAKTLQESNHDYVISMIDVTKTKAHLELNLAECMDDEFMNDAAYNALNGISVTTKKGRKLKTPYPSTNEGFKRLIRDYGSHLLTNRDVAPMRTTTVYLHRIYFLRVVGHAAIEHQWVGVAQPHGSQVGGIILARKPLQFSVAIDFVHEIGFDGHVKHVLLLAVGHARPLLEVALAVVGLDVLHRLHG
jgi:hypothetical protein